MIDPKELMIGNILNYTTSEGHIIEMPVTWDSIHWASTDPKGFNATHSPIPLTPYILERCGFVKKVLSDTNPDEGYYYSLNLSNDKNCDLAILSGDKTGEFDCYLFPYDMIRIKHLHTLQNLVKPLTEKELEIKK